MIGVTISVIDSSEDAGDGWQYDEYRVVDGATAADGSLEIVTIGGQDYVHAKAVGSGSYTTTDGQTNINVGKGHIDVYVIAGQSNTYASLYVDAATADPLPSPGTGYYYGTTAAPVISKTYNSSQCAMRDIVTDEGAAAIGSFWPSLCEKYVNETGHRIYLLNIGLSGQPIATFLPGASNWAHINAAMSDAVAAIDDELFDYTPLGYVWVQGEGDKTTPIPTYETDFVILNDKLTSGDMALKLPRAFISKVRIAQTESISDAQIWLTQNIKDVVMGSTLPDTFTVENGLMVEDDLHYSQAGCNALGQSLAATLAEYLPEDSTPDNKTAMDLLGLVPMLLAVGMIIMIAAVVIARRE